MADLSVFVDESGDFGPYEPHAPFYIVALVFHNQDRDVKDEIAHFDRSLAEIGMPKHIIHAGPLIRREEKSYINLTVDERMKVFNRAFHFTRKVDASYKAFIIEKNNVKDSLALISALSKQISEFLNANLEFFQEFDRIIIYYDNGQVELTKILLPLFQALFFNVEYRESKPSEYRLQQVADLICTLELCNAKMNENALSKSELAFFKSKKDLKKNFLKPLKKKEYDFKE